MPLSASQPTPGDVAARAALMRVVEAAATYALPEFQGRLQVCLRRGWMQVCRCVGVQVVEAAATYALPEFQGRLQVCLRGEKDVFAFACGGVSASTLSTRNCG